MTDEKPRGIADGIRTGIGILTAFKEAIEETLDEAVQRGDLSPERAKHAVRDAAQRVQSSLDDARDRLDFAHRSELDALRAEVGGLRARLERLEGGGAKPTAGAADPSERTGTAGTLDIPID